MPIRKKKLKNGQASYCVRVRLRGEGKSKSFRTLKAAREWESGVTEEILCGGTAMLRRSRQVTFSTVMDKYLEVASKSKSASVLRQTKSMLAFWRDFFGVVTIDKINGDSFLQGLNELCGKGYRPATINRYREVLLALFRYAERDLLCANSEIISDVPRVKQERRRAIRSNCGEEIDNLIKGMNERFLSGDYVSGVGGAWLQSEK